MQTFSGKLNCLSKGEQLMKKMFVIVIGYSPSFVSVPCRSNSYLCIYLSLVVVKNYIVVCNAFSFSILLYFN